MSKGHTLKALVTERLTAAAEEIFSLFETTIAEYEEELCRCKQENQQLQRTRALLHTERAQASSTSPPEPCPTQGITETQIKEEPTAKQEELLQFNTVSVKGEENQQLQRRIFLQHIEGPHEPSLKQEDKELQVCVPKFSSVGVKSEYQSSLLEQRQTEHKEVINSETYFHSETAQNTEDFSETDNDDWMRQSGWFFEQMEDRTGDQTRDDTTVSSPQNKSVNHGDMSGANEGAENNQKQLIPFLGPQRHLSLHTGEMLYSCPFCMKTFKKKFHLERHVRTHSSEKPFGCPLCKKTFGRKDCLRNHIRTHTGEKPFHCPICNKAFADQSNFAVHRRTHTGAAATASLTPSQKAYPRPQTLHH